MVGNPPTTRGREAGASSGRSGVLSMAPYYTKKDLLKDLFAAKNWKPHSLRRSPHIFRMRDASTIFAALGFSLR